MHNHTHSVAVPAHILAELEEVDRRLRSSLAEAVAGHIGWTMAVASESDQSLVPAGHSLAEDVVDCRRLAEEEAADRKSSGEGGRLENSCRKVAAHREQE